MQTTLLPYQKKNQEPGVIFSRHRYHPPLGCSAAVVAGAAEAPAKNTAKERREQAKQRIQEQRAQEKR